MLPGRLTLWDWKMFPREKPAAVLGQPSYRLTLTVSVLSNHGQAEIYLILQTSLELQSVIK